MDETININGVKIPIPADLGGEFKVETKITLPSGKIATFRKGTGRDMMKAQKIVRAVNEEMTDPFALSIALASVIGRIDGKPFIYHDVLDMDIPEATALAGAASENFSSRPRETSQHSSASDSKLAN